MWNLSGTKGCYLLYIGMNVSYRLTVYRYNRAGESNTNLGRITGLVYCPTLIPSKCSSNEWVEVIAGGIRHAPLCIMHACDYCPYHKDSR